MGPQRFFAFATLLLVIGGPILGLQTISHFPFLLTDAEIYRSLGAIAAAGSLFWLYVIFVRYPWLARGFSTYQRVLACGGLGLGLAALVLGVAGPVNAMGARYDTRIVDCVGKRMSRQHDISRRQIVLALRPWPSSPEVVEVAVPFAVYLREPVPALDMNMPQKIRDSLPAQARVRLIVGRGSLGLEWPVRAEPYGPVRPDRRVQNRPA
jgi:hypothetical protein